jgi:hypothetical protein
VKKVWNLVNKKFGRLTVIENSGKRASNGGVIWKCLCDCGNYLLVRGDSLKSGATKSCGCEKIEYYQNKTFGKLTVIEDSGERKGGNKIWKCKCECGNYIFV